MLTLAQIYDKYKTPLGTDYGDEGTQHSYVPIYEELFAPWREKACALVEIGVAHGHSMAMWREYFTKATLWGVDVDFSRIDVDLTKGCNLVQADATSLDVLRFMPQTIDVIIDDGSHWVEDQVKAFILLAHRLDAGGLYIIEDVNDPSGLISRLMLDAFAWPYTLYDFRDTTRRQDDVMLVIKKKQSQKIETPDILRCSNCRQDVIIGNVGAFRRHAALLANSSRFYVCQDCSGIHGGYVAKR